MEKLFKLREHGTNVKTEVIAGVTTFFAMAYIIFVNPTYLSQAGMDFTAVMVATCLSAAVGTLLTAFIANVPFAQAPGMGLNAFFTYTVCFGMGYTWQQGLTIVLISGILFLVITVSPLRSKIIAAIPACLKDAISVGIGLFIAFIGLLNAGIVQCVGVEGGSGYTDMGAITKGSALLALIGLLITGILIAHKVKAAIFIGIIITTVIGIPMGITTMPESVTMSNIGNIGLTAFQLDFGGIMSFGPLPLITAVISFFIVDCFDTVGTLLGTAGNAGMLDKDGNLPGGDRALIADAVATCVGACLGTSTVTTFVESSTGIQEGGRTGLASVVTGLLFLVCVLLAPIAGIVPSAATAPALIIVGVYMMMGASKINWGDFETALPCFLTISMMPFAYSISDGIGFGFISYAVIKICRGKAKEVPVLVYILSVIFIAMYVLDAQI
ncbi:MAG: NCS2 family permease [Lachnospiraceae bacterium]|jgi:AGZA family xanthine/uracil permease-like MFS transporter|nr:NCS2 family permease [Lachnospiraceae bacterium]